MSDPISAEWNLQSPLSFNGLLGGTLCIYHFHSNFNRTFCKQRVETQIKRHVLWRLIWVLLFAMSLKKDAKLIWVKHTLLLARNLICQECSMF